MKKIVIHQPDFLPWLGFFDKISRADKFIILDDVQFARRGWTHRDLIIIKKEKKWLTVPTKKINYYDKINKIEISYNADWINNHYNLIKEGYKNEKNFNNIIDEIMKIYNKKFDLLIDLNIALLRFVMKKLKIKKEIKLSSSFNLNYNSSEKIIELIKITNSNYYITGKPSAKYLDEEKFKKNGIKIEWYNIKDGIFSGKLNEINTDVSSLDYIMKYD